MAPSSVQWGSITLHLDQETFRNAFGNGRSIYFDDCEYDFPQVSSQMTTFDAAGSVLDEDGKGDCRFDRMTFKDSLDIPGFFLGYMSGPILAETDEEREERHKREVLVEEEAASTAGRTL